jgi:hypothetical protein
MAPAHAVIIASFISSASSIAMVGGFQPENNWRSIFDIFYHPPTVLERFVFEVERPLAKNCSRAMHYSVFFCRAQGLF